MAATPAFSDWPTFPFDEAEVKVYRWREEQFRELGFSPPRAVELALSEADLGQARYLLRYGCAPELALRIIS
jgi:hypothetical protein